jgi:hypothetical protein
MKRVVMGAVLLTMLLSLSGCIFVDRDDGGGRHGGYDRHEGHEHHDYRYDGHRDDNR